jgi:hypothetical protein
LSVLQPFGQFPDKCRGISGTLPRVFRLVGNVAVLPRKFTLVVPLLAQSFDARYGDYPPLCNALSLFAAFEIPCGNVIADLSGHYVQGTGRLAGCNPPSISGNISAIVLHECPVG